MSEKPFELTEEEMEAAAGGLKYQSAEGEEINLKAGKANNPTQGSGGKGGKVRPAPEAR